MTRFAIALGLCAALLPAPALRAQGVVGQVNTLWVVPEQGLAWVEPLIAKRRPGGGLWTVDGFVAQRDLAWSIKCAIWFLSHSPADCPGFDRLWRQHDLYFTWPDPDQKRGGPSAGVAFVVAGYSAMLDLPVKTDVVVTGGVDERGRVLAVGGIERKIPAALTAGMAVLCIPAAGAPSPGSLSVEVARRLRIVTLQTADQAFFEAFGQDGPEGARYDRVETLWHDARQALTRREQAKARLALDELLELVPGDLSAARLQQLVAKVDMTVAAQNLFADAQQFERDGLPDEALKAARRAWSYADEPLRVKHRELLERLERANLPPDSRALLDRARDLAQQGDVGGAWRILQELQAREPGHPLVSRYATAWQAYGPVGLLEETTRRRPDDAAGWAALAQAYLAAKAPARAVEVYRELRRRQPDEARWAVAEAQAQAAGGQPAAAAETLRAVRPRWPEAVAEACGPLGLELDPPALTVSDLRVSGWRAEAEVSSTDAAGVPTLEVLLGDRREAIGPGPAARLVVDLGRLPVGPQRLRVTSRDAFGNLAETGVALTVPARDAGPCLTRGEGEPRLLSPAADAVLTGTTPVRVAAAVTAGRVTLAVNGLPWAAADGQAVLALNPTALAPGRHVLTATVTAADGAAVTTPSVTVVVPGEAPTGGEPTDLLLLPATTAALTATAPHGHEAVRGEAGPGAVSLDPPAASWSPGPPPFAGDLALRLDAAGWPASQRLMLGLGDRVAFGVLRDPAVLGPQPRLDPGPLATAVWTPHVPGDYRLPLPAGTGSLTVTPWPALQLLGPPLGAHLTGPTTWRVGLAPALDVTQLTLVDGDQPLATWPSPPSRIVLDPAKLPGGPHLLRLVASLRDGAVVVSPAVAVVTGP